MKPKRQKDKCLRWVNACYRSDFYIDDISKSTYVCSKQFVGGNGPTEDHPEPIPAGYSHEQVSIMNNIHVLLC